MLFLFLWKKSAAIKQKTPYYRLYKHLVFFIFGNITLSVSLGFDINALHG